MYFNISSYTELFIDKWNKRYSLIECVYRLAFYINNLVSDNVNISLLETCTLSAFCSLHNSFPSMLFNPQEIYIVLFFVYAHQSKENVNTEGIKNYINTDTIIFQLWKAPGRDILLDWAKGPTQYWILHWTCLHNLLPGLYFSVRINYNCD